MIVAAGLAQSLAEAAGVAGRAEVAHARDEAELSHLLAAPRDWTAVLLGPALDDPVRLAREVRARLPAVLIAILVEPADAGRVQHDLLLAPIRGDPVRCVPLDEGAPRAIEQHLRHALLRRRHSHALRSANRALATPAAPARRLPPAMEQLLEATPMPMLVIERTDGRLLHRNAAARRLHPGRAVTLSDALAGIDAAIVSRVGAAGDDGITIRRVAWGTRAFDILASPLARPVAQDALLVILDDVTDLVRVEEERRKEADLHATLLAVQSDMGHGVLIAEGGRIVYANEALARMMQLPASALLGRDGFGFLADEERERVRQIHARRLRGDPGVPDLYETTFVDARGARLRVELSARMLPGGGSTVIVVRDITRRVEMQAEMEQARAGLAQMDKLATVGSLVGGLAHEIRTPLTSIMNAVEVVARQVDRVESASDPAQPLREIRASVAMMNDGVDRIRRLMRDMRSFMRGEVPEKGLVQVDGVVAEAVRFFSATQRGNVHVEARLSSRTQVEADGAQLQQIVINLLQNAAEASPSGGQVVVETREEPDAVVVAVVDRGVGIPPDLQPRMFEAFVTTKPRGSGLGLTIVRRLAEIHRAKLRVESTLGEGTRIEVAFPRVGP